MKNIKIYILGAIIVVTLLFLGLKPVSSAKPPLEKLANSVIAKCQDKAFKDTCFEDEIANLTKKLSMEDAFNVTSMVQESVPEFPYCHVLGHRLASIETKKDTSKWKEVIARCPRGSCSNGCVHGAFQERYKNETLSLLEFEKSVEEFKTVCEETSTNKLTGLEQGSCYHALGHLLMYISAADIDKSIKTCDEISLKSDGRDFRPVCYAGAFMQIFQPLDNDDKSLVSKFSLNSENTWSFCSKYQGLKKTKCREESWPLYLDQILKPSGLVDFCNVLDHSGAKSCFSNLFYLIPVELRFNIPAIKDYCSGFTEEYQGECFAMTASRLLEIDKKNGKKAADYCYSLAGKNKNDCFDMILKNASFDLSSDSLEYKELCTLMPDPWKSKCYKNEKN